MNLVRFRYLAVLAALLAAGSALAGCSSAGDASGSTRIFTTVDEGTPITAGAPGFRMPAFSPAIAAMLSYGVSGSAPSLHAWAPIKAMVRSRHRTIS